LRIQAGLVAMDTSSRVATFACGLAAGAVIAAAVAQRRRAAAPAQPTSAPEWGASPFPLDFTGKVAMVTGAARGIGREIAVALHKHGAQVVAMDREAALLQALADEIGCIALPCDLSDTEAIGVAVTAAGKVDMLVNVAGVAIFQQFLEATVDVWDTTMDVNARATWLLTQQVAKGMVARGSGGSVVNISSQSSSVVVSDKHLAYSTSKAAVDHITRSAAISLAKDNVRVNAVNPTVVRTELAINAHGEEGLKKMASKVPLGRICDPHHVADAVLFLLSDRAAMITGVTLPVDGGFIAARV